MAAHAECKRCASVLTNIDAYLLERVGHFPKYSILTFPSVHALFLKFNRKYNLLLIVIGKAVFSYWKSWTPTVHFLRLRQFLLELSSCSQDLLQIWGKQKDLLVVNMATEGEIGAMDVRFFQKCVQNHEGAGACIAEKRGCIWRMNGSASNGWWLWKRLYIQVDNLFEQIDLFSVPDRNYVPTSQPQVEFSSAGNIPELNGQLKFDEIMSIGEGCHGQTIEKVLPSLNIYQITQSHDILAGN